MKNFTVGAVSFVLCACAGLLYSYDQHRKEDKQSFDEALSRSVEELNKNHGKMLDEVTEFDKAELLDYRILSARYIVRQPLAKDYDKAEFNKVVMELAVSKLCASKPDLIALSKGVRYRYTFVYSEGTMLSQVQLDQSNCP